MPARRFPPPWTVEEQDACFVVRDQPGRPRNALAGEWLGKRHVVLVRRAKWPRTLKAPPSPPGRGHYWPTRLFASRFLLNAHVVA